MKSKVLIKILLKCGVLYSVVYVLTDIVTGLMTPDYSFNHQTVSELSAIGAPTQFIWQIMAFIHNPLLILFGFGLIKLSKMQQNKNLNRLGCLIIVWGISSFAWLLFPMNLRGNIGSTSDTIHLVMASFTVMLLVGIIIIGSFISGARFRKYSLFTLAVMTISGIATSQQTARVAMQLPTPWMGITERITSYAPLFWIIALYLVLNKHLHLSEFDN